MNIKDFLMDNYIYIIIVIVLIIVTIIGFLADKQKNGGKKDKGNNNPMPSGYNNGMVANQPITYQPVNNNPAPPMNNIPAANVIPMANINQVNVPNNMVTNPGVMNAMPSSNVSVPQPVEPMNTTAITNPEPMYQPLSEQKPTIAPTNPINNMSSFNNGMNAQPIQNPESLPQPMNTNPVPTDVMPGQAIYNQPMPAPTPMPMATPMSQPMQPMTNEMPASQPVPASPQPIPNPNPETIPSPIAPPQPTAPQPIGFVYGPTTPNQNNNQPM